MVDINIRVKGGLGNQLFIYAAGLYLAENHDGILKVDATTGFLRDKYKRTFELEKFGFVESHEIQSFFSSLIKVIDYKMCMKYRKSIFKLQAKQMFDAPYSSVVGSTHDGYNFYLDGYYQNAKWVLPVLPTLRIKYETASKYLKIHRNNRDKHKFQIAVHIREFESNYSKGLSLYYRRAIEYFKLKLNDIVFFVFSEAPLNKTIKEILAPNNHRILQPTDEDFFRMGQFDGIITANSTYSWWVAALAYDTDGMVVMPGTKVVSEFGSWDPKFLKLPGSHLISLN